MGSKTTSSAAMAMLLAFLNIRLGLLGADPDQGSAGARLKRGSGPYYLLRESLSQTNPLGATAISPTVATSTTPACSQPRRARLPRYIVMLDCGADPTALLRRPGERAARPLPDRSSAADVRARPWRQLRAVARRPDGAACTTSSGTCSATTQAHARHAGLGATGPVPTAEAGRSWW